MPRKNPTASFRLNHTLLRIRDPNVSLPFYLNTLGMKVLTKFHSGDFTVYYLGYDQHDIGELPTKERYKTIFTREGALELAHKRGDESKPNFQEHVSGNPDVEIQGYRGHIGLTVDDVDAACAYFEELNVPFERRLGEAIPENVAFIFDPDGHSIEIVPHNFLPLEST